MESVTPLKPRIAFSDLASELKAALFEPDIQAFRIILAAVAAHSMKPHGYPPVWLMIVGPAGSGKTTLLDTLNLVPVFRLNDLTPQTFLSGYKIHRNGNGPGKPTSLLNRLGIKPIITMKDFTTVLSMRYERKSEIMAQLREIYDGFYQKATGMGEVLSWAGRLTFLTCCTPAVDRDRMAFRIMGDRFMEIRWDGPPSLALAHRVIDSEDCVNLQFLQARVRDYVTIPLNCPNLTPKQADTLATLAHAVAILRTPIIRDEKGYKIQDVGTPESPTRVSQALASIVLASAALDRESFVRDEDMDLAKRVALDSVPKTRLQVLRAVTLEGTPKDSDSLMSMSRWIRERAIEDLMSLDLVEESIAQFGYYYHYTTKMEQLWNAIS